jgi:competence protein ComEC
VLWPRGDAEPGNDASVVLRFEGDGLTSVFLGDLGEEAQRVLAGTDPGQADIVKVAHHGSADQSPELYARLRSRVALISCGLDNSYGHPTERLLGILRTEGSAPFRTDLEGLLLVAPDPGGARVWHERNPAADPGTTVGGRR